MLSVGLVVDDAIVMVENVERHCTTASGRSRPRSTPRASWSGPIIAMTITLAAVYAPVGIQGGLTGALFREFAFTLASAVDRLGRRRADAVADDGRRSCCAPAARERGFAGWINRRFDTLRDALHAAAGGDAALPAGRPRRSGPSSRC